MAQSDNGAEKSKASVDRAAQDKLLDEQSSSVGHVQGAYGGNQIQVLEGLEAVRRNVAMYIGGTDSKGLHHLFTEVSDNAVDEALAGYCDRIDVVLYADGSMSVQDNGRGIPVDINTQYGVSGVELALTKLHAGGKFGGGAYKVSGGLHGVGVSCVNATSDWLDVTVTRDSKVHIIGFERGITTKKLKEVGRAKAAEHGTRVHWHADPQIFSDTQYEPEIIERRLRELAYLNKELTLTFTNERDLPEPDPTLVASSETPVLPLPEKKIFHYPRGIVDYVEHLNQTQDPIHKPIYFAGVKEEVSKTFVEVAIQFNMGYQENMLTFANNINTPMGGTHASGFKTALTRVLNLYARKSGQLKDKDPNLSGEDVREGLAAVISVKLTERPAFESQTKVKLTNAYVEGIVNSIVGEKLSEYLEETPAVAKRIIEKALTSQRARDAARKAAELVKRQSALNSNSLPGKLADCSDRDPSRCELFLVEGDSAGGPAKQGRDRRTQAILPLRGKIVNVGKARVDKVLENEEIRAMITAIGTGIRYGVSSDDEPEEPIDPDLLVPSKSSKDKDEPSYDLSKLRYGKIIIMTDADVDGDHIRTLLLTFFWIYMRPLVDAGHVYIAQPPLYRIKSGKNDQYYAKNEEERDKILERLKGKRDIMVTRFKGLGEMDAVDLAETTMDIDKRRLAQVCIDVDNISAAEDMFNIFMSDKVEPRRDFIVAHAREVTDVDWHG